MQGFLFSRPLPPEDLKDWYEQNMLGRRALWIAHLDDGGPGDVTLGKHLRPAIGARGK
jgi:hypothetical protein